MTEILFIRHGETDYNKKNLYYGHLNPGLNKTGINQLKNTKKKLEEMNEKIDIVFSSDLKRCRQSLELLELDENIEKYFSEELRELNFGDIEGKSYDKIRKEFPHYIDEMKNNWKYFRTEGGESLDDLQKRVVKKIDEIKEKIFSDDRIVPYITKQELKKVDKDFFDLKFEEKKKVLIDLVDKNKLYINYSDIDNEEYDISKEEKQFNNSFYKDVK